MSLHRPVEPRSTAFFRACRPRRPAVPGLTACRASNCADRPPRPLPAGQEGRSSWRPCIFSVACHGPMSTRNPGPGRDSLPSRGGPTPTWRGRAGRGPPAASRVPASHVNRRGGRHCPKSPRAASAAGRALNPCRPRSRSPRSFPREASPTPEILLSRRLAVPGPETGPRPTSSLHPQELDVSTLANSDKISARESSRPFLFLRGDTGAGNETRSRRVRVWLPAGRGVGWGL